MKTYSRRKFEHKLIENVHEFCRLCLQNIRDMETVALFTSENDNSYPPLTTKIMIFTGLEIVNEECLPNVICKECNNNINNFYAFRRKCGVVYQTFKSHLLASKEAVSSNCATGTIAQGEPVVVASECQEDKILLTFVADKPLVVNTLENTQNGNSNEIVAGTEDKATIPEVSNFLKDVLLELGIIRKNGDHCLQSDFLGSTIELETADGCQMTLELAEIGNMDKNIIINEQTCDSTQDQVGSEVKRKRISGVAVCRICGKKFASGGVLRRHARVHSGERPFACRTCPRRFGQREVLRRHELVHLDKRPFACEHCPKSFTQRGALETHRRSHAPPTSRPLALHRCIVCPKFFLHASGLSRHMRAHNGQPPAQCDACGRAFRSRDSLRRHVTAVHSKLKNESQDTQTATIKNELRDTQTNINKEVYILPQNR
ncbi:zinc finger protein 2-like isoform X2 [Aricia agestis]|uniref:zinc finger protein 2-like isoform X2 n=1 Tax=Aricia agestis TaxID=91739 RepID=UPI001C205F47|nr:zinc finger protein 2-like isoform X2 [Aricia agestis]